ncbi:MAG: hypothetical protein WAL91_08995 [Propionicimonas sp.]
MAEIRKHDPVQGNAIVEALRTAMGDPIRPVTPGKPATSKPAAAPATTSWVNLSFTTTDPDDTADGPRD